MSESVTATTRMPVSHALVAPLFGAIIMIVGAAGCPSDTSTQTAPVETAQTAPVDTVTPELQEMTDQPFTPLPPAVDTFTGMDVGTTLKELRDRMYVIGETDGDLAKWDAAIAGVHCFAVQRESEQRV